eukprot:gene14312-19196_t
MSVLDRKRIRLKCRYDGEIRTVTITQETTFTELRKRLSQDYGFDVALKYEDRDGDYIILSSQNDLEDLFLFTDTDTINAIVSETISLPNLKRKTTPKSNVGLFNVTSASMSNSTNNQTSFNLPSRNISNVNRSERFPSLSENSISRPENHNIRWKKGEVLGQGAFGVVYLGLNIETGELMAVKQLSTEEVSRRELSSLENEINLLRSLRHPNIVRYIGTEVNSTALSIFLEYVPGGSLKALIDKFGALEESVAKSYTRQLLIGLEYLHRNGIAHRDIKGANCLVGNDGVIKLADFGNSKHWRAHGKGGNDKNDGLNATQTTGENIKGTPAWMAPEVVRNDQGGSISWKKADVWSLACTTVEMTTGKTPWCQFDNPVTILFNIACQDTLPDYPNPASVELITFLNTCFQRDAQMRPDITSLLLHPFVANMSGSNWGYGNVNQRPSTVSSAVVGVWDTPMNFQSTFKSEFRSNLNISTNAGSSSARGQPSALDSSTFTVDMRGTFPMMQQSHPILSARSEIFSARSDAGSIRDDVTLNSMDYLDPNSLSGMEISRTPHSKGINLMEMKSFDSQQVSSSETPRRYHIHNDLSIPSSRRASARKRVSSEADISLHHNLGFGSQMLNDVDSLESSIGSLTSQPNKLINNPDYSIGLLRSSFQYHPDIYNDPEIAHEKVHAPNDRANSVDGLSNIDRSIQLDRIVSSIDQQQSSVMERLKEDNTIVSYNQQPDYGIIGGDFVDNSISIPSMKPSKPKMPPIVRSKSKAPVLMELRQSKDVSSSSPMRLSSGNNKRNRKKVGSIEFALSVANMSDGELSVATPNSVHKQIIKSVSSNSKISNIAQPNIINISSNPSEMKHEYEVPQSNRLLINDNIGGHPKNSKFTSSKHNSGENLNLFSDAIQDHSFALPTVNNNTKLKGSKRYNHNQNNTKKEKEPIHDDSADDISLYYREPQLMSNEIIEDHSVSQRYANDSYLEEEMGSIGSLADIDSQSIGTNHDYALDDSINISLNNSVLQNTSILSHADAKTSFMDKYDLSLAQSNDTRDSLDDDGYIDDMSQISQDMSLSKIEMNSDDVKRIPFKSCLPEDGMDSYKNHYYEANGIAISENKQTEKSHSVNSNYDDGSNHLRPRSVITGPIQWKKSHSRSNDNSPFFNDTLSDDSLAWDINERKNNNANEKSIKIKSRVKSHLKVDNNIQNIDNINDSSKLQTVDNIDQNQDVGQAIKNDKGGSSGVGMNKKEMPNNNTISLVAQQKINQNPKLLTAVNNIVIRSDNTSFSERGTTAGVIGASVSSPTSSMLRKQLTKGRVSTGNHKLKSSVDISLLGDPLSQVDSLGDGIDQLYVTGTTRVPTSRPSDKLDSNRSNLSSANNRPKIERNNSTSSIPQLQLAGINNNNINNNNQTSSGVSQLSNDMMINNHQSDGLLLSTPQSLEEHIGPITRLRAPLRTNLLLSSSSDGTVRIWGPESSQSRVVLDVSNFMLNNANNSSSSVNGTSFIDQRPERKISLGTRFANNNNLDDNDSVTGLSNNNQSNKSVKILNLWSEDTCDTIWAACSDGALRIWGGSDCKPLRLLKGHEEAVTALEGMDSANSIQSSCLVATGSADRTVRIWDTRAKKPQIFLFRGHGDTVLSVRWGESGRCVVSAGKDKSVRIWDTRAGRLRVTLEKHFGAVNALRMFSETSLRNISTANNNNNINNNNINNPMNNPCFISGGRDSMLNIWNANGDCIHSQSAHKGSLLFLSDINYNYRQYNNNNKLSAIDRLNGNNLLNQSYNNISSSNSSIIIIPSVISIGSDNSIKVWDMKKYKLMNEITNNNQNGNITKAVWTSSQSFITGSSTGAIRLYENNNNNLENNIIMDENNNSKINNNNGVDPWSYRELTMHNQSCTDLIATESFFASSSRSGQICRWNIL